MLYTFIGGLGFLFFGMKLMSDALQQAASDVITKVINSLTSNRVLSLMVGAIVTMIVQSSSITTVMVVGFVNSGLMQLTQAIGVIFGANIGTTITGWIISIKIGEYVLLLIALGVFPTVFSKNPKYRHIGMILFGVGMVFLGLDIMSNAFKPLRDNAAFLELISSFSEKTYPSYLASIFIGCVLTMIIQSSSAMLGITIALASTGIIDFRTSSALVLGENIGTTITAILASIGTSANARRAALAHSLFNVTGVAVLFPFLPFHMDFIEWLIPGVADFTDASGGKPYIAAHIAASHSAFNVIAATLFLPFLNHLARLVTRLIPDNSEKKKSKLIFVGDPADVIPATAIAQASSEARKMKDILERMYKTTRMYVSDPISDTAKLGKVADYEQITDNIQKEVTVFLVKVMERPLSTDQSSQTFSIIKIVDEFESIADYLDRIAHCRSKMDENILKGATKDEFIKFMDEIWEFFRVCTRGLFNPENHDLSYVQRKSEELRVIVDDMRNKHIERISQGEYEAESAITYSDMVVALRKIRAHALNVAEAADGLR